MQGNSTIVGSSGGYALNVDINSAGTVAITNTMYWKSGTFSYTAGTINAGTSTVYHFSVGAFTLNVGAQTLFNVTLIASSVLGSVLNCSGTLTLGATTLNTYNVNCSGSLVIGASTCSGTSVINLIGTGTWSGNFIIQNNININTSGTITFSSTVYYQIGTLTYLSGKIETSGNKFYLGTSTLINCHKINFNRVVVGAGTTLTMNEFFSGSANLKTTISSTGANYLIVFQDDFEKISKFVNISGATISRRNQLLVITNSKKSSTNLGIRYINQSPNGVPKGDPSIQNILTPGLSTFLVSDPVYT